MWQPALEAAPPERLRALQEERLSSLLRRAGSRIPFYAERLRMAGVTPGDPVTLEDLPGLPTLTKADWRAQYPLGLLGVERETVARLHATSGTRGKPTLVAYTAADLRSWADICARMLVAAGCRRGATWYVASGYGLFTGGLGAHYGLERVGATVVPASSGDSHRLLKLLLDVPAAGIHCIPSYMLRLAEVAREAGVDPKTLGLRHGSFGGETWSDSLRRRIETAFDMVACDVYGLSECFGPGVAYECQVQQGLHLSEDHVLAEVVDPQTAFPVPAGHPGELVLTTLTKRAMPVLRYRTGDLTRFLSGPCPCGRTTRRLARISGRTDDMLIVRGVNLFPAEVERVLLGFPELSAQYRLVLERPAAMDVLTLEVELDRPAEADPLTQRVREQIKRELGLSATVRLCQAGTLPRSEGKAKRVLDLRPEESQR